MSVAVNSHVVDSYQCTKQTDLDEYFRWDGM